MRNKDHVNNRLLLNIIFLVKEKYLKVKQKALLALLVINVLSMANIVAMNILATKVSKRPYTFWK